MTLEDLGNIGELIASIGVLVSLIYLASQIKQSSKMASIQASQSLLVDSSKLQTRIALDDELSRIMSEGCASYDDLSPGDRRKFYAILGEIFTRYELHVQMNKANMLNPDNFAASTRHIQRMMKQPGVRSLCNQVIEHDISSTEFKKVLTDLLGQTVDENPDR